MTEITAAEDVARKELLNTLKKGEKDYLEGRFSTGEEVSERIDKTLEKIKGIDLEKGEMSGSFRTEEELMERKKLKKNKEINAEFESTLPEYLRHDIDAYKEGLKKKSSLLDCLWGELYGSINIAQIDDGLLTPEQADYLRKKYLFRAEKIEGDDL